MKTPSFKFLNSRNSDFVLLVSVMNRFLFQLKKILWLEMFFLEHLVLSQVAVLIC